ncbi:MAG TPA: cupredoxin domain-containing protein [Nitrososphaerales archaeon]|nr:cupredoxin domain-containing protein [Nitrososphaerales archaeon]
MDLRRGLSSVAVLSVVLIAILGVSALAYVDSAQGLGDQVSSLQSQVNSLAAGGTSGQGGNWTQQTCSATTGSVTVTLIAKTAQIQIAKGVAYNAWTFNGTVPGPTIFVRQCEQVHFKLINNDTMPHSIDFHAAEVNWATVYAPVAPGGSISFDFAPAYPGVFMYHCGVPPVLEHIGNGMYGVIIVNGTGTNALPPAPGGQYVIIESEFYPNAHPNSDGSYSGNYSQMLASTPTYVVFNGYAFKYQTTPLVVQPNQRVRLYLFNEGPNLWEAFHVIGAILDTAYVDGNPNNQMHGVQTLSIPPSGGAIVDMYFKDPGGQNPFVNHSFADMQKGAMGIFQVANTNNGSTTTTTTTTSASGPVVSILPMSGMDDPSAAPFYSPQNITVVIGVNNTVTWANNDDVPHTITATDGTFNSGNLNAGQSWTHTFTTPGTYTYFCSYHSWMKGTITVIANTG